MKCKFLLNAETDEAQTIVESKEILCEEQKKRKEKDVSSSQRAIQNKIMRCMMSECSPTSKNISKVTQSVYDLVYKTESGFQSSMFKVKEGQQGQVDYGNCCPSI